MLAHEPLPTRATKAGVKKSRKIAEGLPHAVDQAETVIFLDFEGNENPSICFETGAPSGASNLFFNNYNTDRLLLPRTKAISFNRLLSKKAH